MAEATPPEGRGVLTKADIRRLKLVEDFDEDNFPPAAYDLRVGHIITPTEYVRWEGTEGRDSRGRRRDSLNLGPGETATLATLEKVNLERHSINALIVPRNRSAQRGLLTLNAGHIDPGHYGFVTGQVINLTDRPLLIHLRESYFSIVFFYLTGVAQPRKRLDPDEVRLRDLRSIAAQAPVSLIKKESLEKVFVSYDDLNFELIKRVWVLLLGLAILAALGLSIWQAVG